MRDADWPRLTEIAPRVGSRRAQGRGLKMSSRCVIAYIDPTLCSVYGTQQHSPTLLHLYTRLAPASGCMLAIANVPARRVATPYVHRVR